MSEFVSCYFCGAAVDADVRRRPVVPDGDDVPTVDLCPTCHRKLSGVVAAALEAAGNDAVAVEAVNSTADEIGVDAEPTVAGGTDLLHDIDDPEPTDAPEESDDAVGEAAEGVESGGEGGEESGDEGPETDPDPELDSDSSHAPEAHADGTAAGGTAGGDTADRGTAIGVDDGDRDDGADEDTADDATDSAASAREQDGAASRETASLLTTPSAKKVVRLLQNRAFPVDREEFQVVASNAYDIPMDDCEAVVDALVAEGYVDAAGEELVRPEG